MSANAAASEPSSSSSSTPQGQGTRSSPRLREKQVMFEVLDNPSLREEILKHAIIGSNKKVDLRTACNLRLIQKSWDQSVLGILWKLHEPLYEVACETGGKLDAAIKTFSASSPIPPPPLKLGPFSFKNEKIQQFSTFVTKCGPALFQMEIEMNEFEILPRSIVAAPWSSFSRLHKLKIRLPFGSRSGHEELAEKERLIESIFRGATALAELVLSIFDHSFPDPAPDVTFLDSLTFPPTLIKIKLETRLEAPQATALLNALVKSPLPNVTSFSLVTCKPIFPNDQLLFSILDKWKTSLKTLKIGGDYNGPEILCPIRFPVMEELEKFSVRWMTAVLEETGLDSMVTCLPKLRTLRLHHQTSGLLRNWTESSVFDGVTHLELLLADDGRRRRFDDKDETDENLVSVNMEAMQLVNAVFPNLRKLGLGISSSDPSGLKYVFMEMRQLEELQLHVFGKLYDPSGDEEETDPWDPILTGLPDEMWDEDEEEGEPDCLEEDGENLVSITNLQELKRLSVTDCRSFFIRYDDKYGSTPSLISDTVFEHAYLKMPKLTHLFFEGPFEASEEMRDKWKSDQRRSLTSLPPFWEMD